MINGKRKALTFSFDDGVRQDLRFMELLEKYGMKGTFNINSSFLGREGTLEREGKTIPFGKVTENELNRLYENHEVAVHTLTHPNLTTLDEKEIIRQVEDDRLKLSYVVGYEVLGMAYPCGGVNNDDRVAAVVKNYTGVRYARTITSTYSFNKQENLYRFNPTCYPHGDGKEKFMKLAQDFINAKSEEDMILYIWGHTFEFDIEDTWQDFEDVLKVLAGREDIFYGTNKEVLL